MERKAIHDQITTLLDKINHLNENVKDGQKLHPVEVDLFLGYLKDLQEAILKLTEFEGKTPVRPELKVTTKIEEEIKAEPDLGIEKNGSQKVKIKFEQPDAPKPESKSKPTELEIPKEEKKIITEKEKIIIEEKKPVITSLKKVSSTLNDRFKKDSTEVEEKLTKGNKKKLKDSIDIAQKYIYINELFAGNAEQFNKSLKELDQCKSVEEAVSYIQNLETIFPWKEKSKFAKQFKDSVIQSIEV